VGSNFHIEDDKIINNNNYKIMEFLNSSPVHLGQSLNPKGPVGMFPDSLENTQFVIQGLRDQVSLGTNKYRVVQESFLVKLGTHLEGLKKN
jgi:hypothetical protein